MPEKTQGAKPDLPDLSVGLDLSSFSAQRKRRAMLQVHKMATDATAVANDASCNWPDAVTSDNVFSLILPWDWVFGTDIVFKCGVLQTATGGTPTLRWDSAVGTSVINTAFASGLVFSNNNLDSTLGNSTGLTQNEVRMLAITIPAPILTGIITDLGLAWQLQWQITRIGGSGFDTVNAAALFRGAWLEYYSTYDYVNRISD